MVSVLNSDPIFWAYIREKTVLSKKEGGAWGLVNLPEEYHPLLRDALREYEEGENAAYDPETARQYAAYMLERTTTESHMIF